MNFEPTERSLELALRVRNFVNEHVMPNQARYQQQAAEGSRWAPVPPMAELQA